VVEVHVGGNDVIDLRRGDPKLAQALEHSPRGGGVSAVYEGDLRALEDVRRDRTGATKSHRVDHVDIVSDL
jgi:hypothetical protein